MSDETALKFEGAEIYQQDFKVLTDVNLYVNKGEFVYLIGRVGSGKSSLLKTLYAELPVGEGNVEICGYQLNTIRGKAVPKLRRKLGIVFQDFQLLTDRSVYQNLRFVLKATDWKSEDADKRIGEVLDQVGLREKMDRHPHELSGGEQQRVVIARALLNHPEIILADEPTGNLDPETSEGIMRLLVDISTNGTAVLMATHNYNLLKKFPARTYKCEEGKVSESKAEGSEIDFDSL